MQMQEFFQAYKFLRSMLPDLEDMLQLELKELLDDFKVDYYDYEHNGGPQPAWDDYAEAIDAMLADEGYPALFAEYGERVA